MITPESLSTFLGASRYSWRRATEKDEVGLATGLVYTEAGGDTVSIEVLLTHSDTKVEGKLLLTGQLGDVMKESAQAAWSFVKSRFEALGIPEESTRGRDIHLHVPAGAVPKDGPSAGITLATVLASAFSGRAVRHDLAMTGEITLRGKVLPVGGVKEKVFSRPSRPEFAKFLLPQENEKRSGRNTRFSAGFAKNHPCLGRRHSVCDCALRKKNCLNSPPEAIQRGRERHLLP